MNTGDGALSLENQLLKSAVSRATRKILPFLILMFVMSYLDRANIGFAKQAYQAATGISNAAFAFGAGIFFISYAIFEIPSNLMLRRIGAKIWLSRIMITWGLISSAMAFAHSETSFYLLRMLLGAAEAGFFPGVILYMTYWFPARYRGKVIAFFYFGSPLSLMFGGPISGLLLDFDGTFGLTGWQLLFIVEGLLASAVGVWAYFYLANKPVDAKWMPAAERAELTKAIEAEDLEKAHSGKVGLRQVFTDSRLLHFAAIYFLMQVGAYGVNFYLPTQVSALLGVKVGLTVGLVTAIPYACAIAAGLVWPEMAMRTGRLRTFTIISLMGVLCGLVVSAQASPALAIAALCVVTAGIITSQPIFWNFPTAYLGGAAAAGGIATINAIGNLGGFFAPNAKAAAEAYFHSPAAGLYVLAASALFAAILVLLLPGVNANTNPHHDRGPVVLDRN